MRLCARLRSRPGGLHCPVETRWNPEAVYGRLPNGRQLSGAAWAATPAGNGGFLMAGRDDPAHRALLLLLAGDVERNPGPTVCGGCRGNVGSSSVRCDTCGLWYHRRCTDLQRTDIRRLASGGAPWTCRGCSAAPPARRTTPDYPCGRCGAEVAHNSVRCSSCARWHHRRCTTLTVAALGRMARSGEPWTCETCNRVMPRLDASPTSPATVAIAQGSTDRTVRRSPPRGRATRPSATQRRTTETP